MANFIPALGFGARLGNELGGVLGNVGQGIGSGIETRTEDILRDLAQRKAETMRADALRQFMPHASQQELQALSSFPEAIQFQALQGGFGQQAPQSGLQALQKMPFTPEQVAQLKALPEQQRNQILQKLSQGPSVQQQRQPISLGKSLQRQAQLAGKAGAGPKLSKADEKFDTKVVNDVETAQDIVGLLDSIDEIIDRGDFGYGGGASLVPNALLSTVYNEDTQALNNLFNALIVKQSAAESQGRGSDLLRKMIAEGKLSLGQHPEVMKFVSKRLREEQGHKIALGQARDAFYDQYGYAPRAEQTRQLAAKLQQQERKSGKSPFGIGSTFEGLPTNAPVGTQIRDSETGVVLQSTGNPQNPWIEVQGG